MGSRPYGPSVDQERRAKQAIVNAVRRYAPSTNGVVGLSVLDALTAAGFVVVRADGLTHGDTLERFGFAPFPHDATPVWRVVEREP